MSDDAPRRDGIVRAATGVFLRYGSRKTSMDDVARVAQISRQGLYLHFKTKDALFRAVVDQMLDDLRDNTWRSLDDPGLPLSDRLAGGFEAFHAVTVGVVDSETHVELLRSAQSFADDRMRALEKELVATVADLLDEAGHSGPVSPGELAQHLFDASAGAKHEAPTLQEYRRRLHVSVKVVTGLA
jgi:AcrR family transcriptional regulator